MLQITAVLPGSTGARAGLEPGDRIVSINGETVNDVIDYRYHISDERITITAQKRGAVSTIRIVKAADDDLGIEVSGLRVTRCRNRCIFCFVDQMPPGCRPSLYIRDDDYRASFLHGNYITLGTLNQPDRERIFAQRLSPLYISVHTTEPALRSFMLGNRKAPDILSGLKKLALGGIRFHAQIVLCPGINDGARLEKTLDELSGLFPAVISIAVVPVGLTAHRKGLYRLAPYTRAGARGVLRIVDRYAVLFRKSHGTRLVFASDEFYVKAGVQVPGARSYEDFPQIENGVGMAADFLREVKGTRVPSRIAPIRVTVATGVSFGRILKRALAGLERVRNARVRTIIVQNRFFGPSVTVSGLLTGSDIAQGLKNKRLGDLVLVPANSLKEDEPVFLDNMTLNQLQKILKRPVRPVAGFKDLIAILKKGA